MPNPHSNHPRRTLLLTGASRGIGHATVIRFSSAGWRVITCSRHPFPEECPWDAGPEDHIQVDLADHADTERAIKEIRSRLTDGQLHALVNNAAISPKGRRRRTHGGDRDRCRRLDACVQRQLLRADHAGARTDRGTEGRQGLGGERHLDRGLARASVRRRRLRHVESGARRADARNGFGFRPARRAGERDRAGRDRHSRSFRPAPKSRSCRTSRSAASARPTKSRA